MTILEMNDVLSQIPFSRCELDLNIVTRFDKIASLQPSRIALRRRRQSWTYEQFQKRTIQIAEAIRRKRIPGSGCVAFLSDHTPEMVIIAMAILRAGNAFLCIHPGNPLAAKQEVVEDAAPELIVCTAQHFDTAQTLVDKYGHCGVLLIEHANDEFDIAHYSPVEIGSNSPAAIYYTSGSTGKPKGIVKSHRSILHRAWLAAKDDGVSPSDRQSLLTFCSFASSEADLFGALLNGATVEMFDIGNSDGIDFSTWIDEQQITILHPPVAWFRRYLSLLDGKHLHPSVRLVALAGDLVLPPDVQQWRQKFSPSCTLRHRFSSTEAGHMAVAFIDTASVAESGQYLTSSQSLTSFQRAEAGRLPSARPVSDKSLSIVDEGTKPLPPGQPGELIVRSSFLSDGYWRRPADTAAKFFTDKDFPNERCFATGDLGYLDAEGGFVFQGRKDGQVKIRGYRVEIGEIERNLLELPAVREAAVIVDRANGEAQLFGFAVLRTEAKLEPFELRKLLLDKLPSWKVPDEVHIVDTLPLTLTGKIDRQKLRTTLSTLASARKVEAAFSEEEAGQKGEPAISTIERLTQIWQDFFPRTKFGPDDDFFDLGGHSMLCLTLSVRVAAAFNVNLPWNSPYEHRTIHRLSALIDELRAAGSASLPASQTLKLLTPNAAFYPPIYIVPGDHGVGVEPVSTGRFIELLSGELTAYALVARSADGKTAGHKHVVDMAADYIEEIRKVQPVGPYILLGGCIGAAVSYEMARQLDETGEKVSLLMIDGSYMTTARWIPDSVHKFATSMYLRQFPKILRVRLRNIGKALVRLQWRHKLPHLLRATRTIYDEIEATFYAKTEWIIFTRKERFQLQYRKAIRRYRPRRYSGHVKLLLTADFGKRSILRDWQRVAAGGVQVEYLECNHGEHLKEFADQSANFTKRSYKEALAEHQMSSEAKAI